MIVPTTPRKTLLVSLFAASMDPLGLLVARLRGVELPATSVLVWAYIANYVCAVLAVLPSKIITRLGKQISRAREMGSYRLADQIGAGGMGEVWRRIIGCLLAPRPSSSSGRDESPEETRAVPPRSRGSDARHRPRPASSHRTRSSSTTSV